LREGQTVQGRTTMPADDPLLIAASIVIACAALAGLRPVVSARLKVRAAAREARMRSQRRHCEIEALRQARRKA